MTETVYGVFNTIDNAERALSALKDHGAVGNEVSVVRRHDGAGLPQVENEADHSITVTGPADVVAGGLKGGAAGLALGVLAGAVALTIPGIGPILAAGPIAAAIGAALATTAAGATAGMVVGGLVDQGVPDEHARRYEAAVERGDILVAVRSPHLSSADATLLLEKYGATETSRHAVNEPRTPVIEPPVIDRNADLNTAPPSALSP